MSTRKKVLLVKFTTMQLLPDPAFPNAQRRKPSGVKMAKNFSKPKDKVNTNISALNLA